MIAVGEGACRKRSASAGVEGHAPYDRIPCVDKAVAVVVDDDRRRRARFTVYGKRQGVVVGDVVRRALAGVRQGVEIDARCVDHAVDRRARIAGGEDEAGVGAGRVADGCAVQRERIGVPRDAVHVEIACLYDVAESKDGVVVRAWDERYGLQSPADVDGEAG